MARLMRLCLACVSSIVLLSTLGCNGGVSASASLDRPWEALPEDVVGVAYFDVASLRASELYRTLDAERQFPPDAQAKLEEFRQATGFDMTQDLESITFGAGYDAGERKGPYYFIAKGRFDLARIEQYARDREEVEVQVVEGLTTYVVHQQGPETDPVATFLDESTMVVATAEALPRLLQSIEGSAPNAAASSLAHLMAASSGQVFFAMHIPQEMRQAAATTESSDGVNMLAGIQEPFRRVETLLLTLDLSSDFELAVTAEVDTPASGQLLHDAVQGFLAMGKMMMAQEPETAELLNQTTLELDGKTVRFGMVLTREQVETAMGQTASTPVAPGLGG